MPFAPFQLVAIILVHNHPAKDPAPSQLTAQSCHSDTERLCHLDDPRAPPRYRLAMATGRLMDRCAPNKRASYYNDLASFFEVADNNWGRALGAARRASL